MATGPENYGLAEQLLAESRTIGADDLEPAQLLMATLAEAQVRATLALAAATAPIIHGNTVAESAAWAAALGAAPPYVRLAWWLDDGRENPGKPPLYTTYDAACTAGIQQYKRDNPFADIDSQDALRWLDVEDAGEATREDCELVVNGHRTGIFVRPIRPQGAA